MNANEAASIVAPCSEPTMLFYDDPQYWRERADEARAMAKFARNPEVMAAMLRIAVEYDHIIHLTERRLAEHPSSKVSRLC